MTTKLSTTNFWQPIISLVGLGVSVVGAILPLFGNTLLIDLFINERLAKPISFLALVLGLAIVWQIISQPYIHINLGKLKERGRGFHAYWKTLGPSSIVWILLALEIIFCMSFLYMASIKINANYLIGLIQAFIYLLFFLCVIAIFSILFSQTKQRFIYNEDKDKFPDTIFETLEKNRLVKPYVEIYENKSMTPDELRNEGINNVFLARRIKVKTSIQKVEIIEFVVSNDGREIIKILKKQEQAD